MVVRGGEGAVVHGGRVNDFLEGWRPGSRLSLPFLASAGLDQRYVPRSNIFA